MMRRMNKKQGEIQDGNTANNNDCDAVFDVDY